MKIKEKSCENENFLSETMVTHCDICCICIARMTNQGWSGRHLKSIFPVVIINTNYFVTYKKENQEKQALHLF